MLAEPFSVVIKFNTNKIKFELNLKVYKLYKYIDLLMIIPIRCMTCGNMIASKWKKYQETLSSVKVTARSNLITNDIEDLKDETAEFKALNEVGVVRYCCRRHLLAHTDIIDIL